ncbi:ATP-dependent nuclease [Mangrovibacterium diazotrophicum]|uniref:Putative ATP-dependent endonuclease of OLD family n=1 Tax=Mangrovibacterium diazotrophicum TaxID=1261403 RepID=A0A419WAY5_9BACT|nr:AAA family ATPase [Mangrovibacterium diazotrophicum]RKD92640.1 putative ATP-dependent endonuclease of OLD family [Mangrovibacterium diazotrophicum]
MGILIDQLRVSGFRGLDAFEISLSHSTVLTGTNNVGKTSVLKALQLALGSRTFLTVDDLNIAENSVADQIIVDIRIIPVGADGKPANEFEEDWETIFTADNIQIEGAQNYVGLRNIFSYNRLKSEFEKSQVILKSWTPAAGQKWQDLPTTRARIDLSKMPFYYIEAQRDVVDDLKQRTSFLGKLLADVSKSYSSADIGALEELIKELNEQAVQKSDILSTIRTVLKGVDTAMDRQDSKIELSPFSKKLRDLNKNISIHYGEAANSFTMDYHGMGTRSWSSLLTFKAFVTQNATLSAAEDIPFFPIIAIEEPEAHLHPNAQKKLYGQMYDMPGQKIISTHSPYIASCAGFNEIRGLYKENGRIKCGEFNYDSLTSDEQRKLRQKVINTRGEIFFSKAIVLFEGETEEQALPILAEKYFNRPAYELGIDFIGVGGAGAYFPFIQFAEAFNIPWYIFSDGEPDPVAKMTAAVRKLMGTSFTNIQNEENIFIIDGNEDFEKYIVRLNFLNDIITYVKSVELPKCVNIQHRQRKEAEIDRLYNNQYVLDQAKNNKTEWALIFAYAIYQSRQALPPLVIKMLNQIKSDLHYD